MSTVEELIAVLASEARAGTGRPWPASYASVGTALHPASTEKLDVRPALPPHS